jgi:hypothetical protein
LGENWINWLDEAYLPSGEWTKGELIKTEKELYEGYKDNIDDWKGVWVKNEPTVILRAASLSLEGAIGVNFKVDIPGELMHIGTTAEVSHPDRGSISYVTSYPVDDLPTDQNGRYVVTNYVYSTEVADDLIISFKDANGDTVRMTSAKGTDFSAGYHYSVQTYINSKLDKPEDTFYPLCRALDFYSKSVLNYWKGGTYSLDEAGLGDISTDTLLQYKTSKEGVLCEGLSNESVSLILESTTTIRYKFILAEGYDIDSYTFSVDGDDSYRPVYSESDGKYILEIRNIGANDLNKMFEITIEKDGNIYKRRYSAMSYAYTVVNKGEDLKMVDVVKTLYNYCMEAEAFFEQ